MNAIESTESNLVIHYQLAVIKKKIVKKSYEAHIRILFRQKIPKFVEIFHFSPEKKLINNQQIKNLHKKQISIAILAALYSTVIFLLLSFTLCTENVIKTNVTKQFADEQQTYNIAITFRLSQMIHCRSQIVIE